MTSRRQRRLELRRSQTALHPQKLNLRRSRNSHVLQMGGIPATAVPIKGGGPPEPVLVYYGIIDFLQVSQVVVGLAVSFVVLVSCLHVMGIPCCNIRRLLPSSTSFWLVKVPESHISDVQPTVQILCQLDPLAALCCRNTA